MKMEPDDPVDEKENVPEKRQKRKLAEDSNGNESQADQSPPKSRRVKVEIIEEIPEAGDVQEHSINADNDRAEEDHVTEENTEEMPEAPNAPEPSTSANGDKAEEDRIAKEENYEEMTEANATPEPLSTSDRNDGLEDINEENYLEEADGNPEPAPTSEEPIPKYAFVQGDIDGELKDMVLIFRTHKRKKCYEFVKSRKRYYCQGCQLEGHEMYFKVVNTSDGSIEFDYRGEHKCKPIGYVPENYFEREESGHAEAGDNPSTSEKISKYAFVKKKVNGVSTEMVLAFRTRKRKKCFEFVLSGNKYFCQGCKACYVVSIEDGNVEVVLNADHECNPIKYLPENYTEIAQLSTNARRRIKGTPKPEGIIIKKPDFKFVERNVGKGRVTRLVIFNPNDRSKCMEYGPLNKTIGGRTYYNCLKCRYSANSKKFGACYYQEHDHVKLSLSEHSCYIDYRPDDEEPLVKVKAVRRNPKFQRPKIHQPNYNIYTVEGSDISRLTIVDPHDDTNMYEYSYDGRTDLFRCAKCMVMKKNYKVHAKLIQGDDGEYYVQPLKNWHICTPKDRDFFMFPA